MSETAEIDDNASPLKPIVFILNKSSAFFSLEVECLLKHFIASSLDIPIPSSIIFMDCLPASLIIILIFFALASILFSSSSFTTEEGL